MEDSIIMASTTLRSWNKTGLADLMVYFYL